MANSKQVETLPSDPTFDWDEWEYVHSRIHAAMGAQSDALVCVSVTQTELKILVRTHLELLEVLGGVDAGPEDTAFPELREFVLGRIISYIRSLAISEKEVQFLSASVAGKRLNLGDKGPFICLDDLDHE